MMEEHFTPLAEQDCTSSNQALVILPWTRFTSIKKYSAVVGRLRVLSDIYL